MRQRWLPAVGHSDYEVSNLGHVRRALTRETLPVSYPPSRRGIAEVSLGGRHKSAVHRLVLDAFVGVETRDRRYCWVDGDKSNNALANLERVGTRCQCGQLLTSDSSYQRGGDGDRLRSLCRDCTARRRRRRHDKIEDAKRRDLSSNCEICGKAETVTRGGKVRRPTIDHDHSTGQIRGVLCGRCNSAIGLMLDDPSIMRAAARYIEKYSAMQAHVA